MNIVETLHVQSELALAAYANLPSGILDDAYEDALIAAGMSQLQAEEFARNWKIVDQYTDFETGASATVFQNKADGKTYLAVRGTELDMGDFSADYLLSVGVSNRLNPQYTVLKSQMATWLANGTLTGGFTITGHSLGGYLAVAIKESFPSAVDAYLYNAPGSGGLIGNILDLMFDLYSQESPGYDGIWNVKASEGLSLITGLGGQPSSSLAVQIEAAAGLGLGNHSIVRLVDSLAIQALYAKIDDGLEQMQLNRLLDAQGIPMAETYEAATDALGKLFVPGYAPLLSSAPGERGTLDDREALYQRIYQIRDAIPDGLSVIDLTQLPASDLIAAAKQHNGIAYRYALRALNPFAVTGNDVLYANHNENGKLDRYDPETGEGSLSEEWIADRAAMLAWVIKLNSEDVRTTAGNPYNPADADTPRAYFLDLASKQELFLGQKEGSGENELRRRFIFGDDKDNTIKGAGVSDRLYGGDGGDYILGLGGDDWLEGNAGNDILDGGYGKDWLIGGMGNDILIGGKDDDQLNGGKGFDSYVWKSGDGHDKIIDIDRKGRILINGQGVGVLIQQSATSWVSVDGKVTLTQGANWILSIEGGGSLNLGTSFANGDYGIHRLALPTPIGVTLTGDYGPLDTKPDTPEVDKGYDALGSMQAHIANNMRWELAA
jgi:hypothetical protein